MKNTTKRPARASSTTPRNIRNELLAVKYGKTGADAYLAEKARQDVIDSAEHARKNRRVLDAESAAQTRRSMQPGRKEMTETEHDRLLKTIGAIALVCAEKLRKYQRGDKPNAKAIADAVQEVIEELEDADVRGLGSSNVRASITAGLQLLLKQSK